MKKPVVLILIFSSVLFVLFQNFSVPTRVLPLNRKFESNEVDPAKRVRDLVKFEIGEEVFSKFEELRSNVRLEWGGREPASETPEIDSEVSQPEDKDPLKYNFANLRTIRLRDRDSELNCRVESNGVALSFQQKLGSTSSYIIEHNTEQQKSQAKFQLSW